MRKILKSFSTMFLAACCLLPQPAPAGLTPGTTTSNAFTFRGLNVSSGVSDETLSAAKRYGANVVRVTFSDAPLRSNSPPYALVPSSFRRLDHILDYCESIGLKVIIDPHTTPGTSSNFTTFPTDDFWTKGNFQDYLCNTWKELSDRYKNRSVVAGYDLLNEPCIGNAGFRWNDLVARLVRIIRRNGDYHYIVIETPVGFSGGRYVNRLQGINCLDLPADNQLVVSPHMYEPLPFTHQGVTDHPTGVRYPGMIGAVNWNKSHINEIMENSVLSFQSSHPGVPIWFGEFSASRLGGNDSDQYVGDVIDVMEKHNWAWNYHTFRGAAVWDAELPAGNPLPSGPRSSLAPRIQLLRHYFAQNN